MPLGRFYLLKKDYYLVKVLLESLIYNRYNWEIIEDFKMVGFPLGLQGCFIKSEYSLCLWDSKVTSDHYKRRLGAAEKSCVWDRECFVGVIG